MIRKVILDPNEELSPFIFEWSEEKEDYVIDVPKGITRYELNEALDELNRITHYNE